MARRKGFIYNQQFIDTLVALRGILPGDEIIMGPDPAHDTSSDENLIGRVLVVDVGGMYPDGTYEPWVCGADRLGMPGDGDHGTYLTRKNIVAWRRPKGEPDGM